MASIRKRYDVANMLDEIMLTPYTPLLGLLPPPVVVILVKNGIRTVLELQSVYPNGLLKMRGLGMLRFKQVETAFFPGKSFIPGRIFSPISQVRGS